MTVSVNYTAAMEAAIREASPIDYTVAKRLGIELGRKPRSIVAKAISMVGVEYNAAPPTNKNGNAIYRKADTVKAIEKALCSGDGSLAGLVKASAAALDRLLSEIA
jgi:hypothetical protein